MNLSEMTQTMTDDAKSVIKAFGDTPVMTLEALITLTGLSEYTMGFILEPLRQAGLAQEKHGRWRIAEGNVSVTHEKQ